MRKCSFFLCVFFCIEAVLLNGQNPINIASRNKHFDPENQDKTILAAVLDEDFESGTLPAGWQNQYGAATFGWQFGTDLSSAYWNIPPHTGYAAANDDECNCDMSSVDLITPVIDLSAGGYTLEFDYYTYSGSGTSSVYISIDAGLTWQLAEDLTYASTWTDDYQIDLSAFSFAGVKLKFHYNDGGAWDWGFALDNVRVFNAGTHDVAVIDAGPEWQFTGLNYFPEIRVRNVSSSPETLFDVSCQIAFGGTTVFDQTETVNGITLLPGDSMDFVFNTPFVPVVAGTYQMYSSVSMTGDVNPYNDSLETQITFFQKPQYSHQAYAINVFEGCLDAIDLNNGNITPLGNVSTGDFPMSMTFIDTVLVLLRNSGHVEYLYENGSVLDVGNLQGIDGEPMAFAHDQSAHLTYLLVFDSGYTLLYTLNFPDLNAVLIDTICECTMISAETDNMGNLNGICLDNDSLYQINPLNALPTALGYIGHDIHYAQDLAWSDHNQLLYGMLMTTGAGSSMLGTLDTGSGFFSSICTYSDQYTGFAIHSLLTDLRETEKQMVSIWPNPASDIIHLSTEGQANVCILDAHGRIVLNTNVIGQDHLNVTHLQNGMYFIRCTRENETAFKQFIIQR